MGKKFSRQKTGGGATRKGNAYEASNESTSEETMAANSGGANKIGSTIDMECHHSDAINCLGINSKQTDRLEVYTCSDDKTAIVHQWLRNDNIKAQRLFTSCSTVYSSCC